MTPKALFLDRDGVINVDHGYASRPEQIDFISDIFPLCKWFQQQGYIIIVITNQSGIGRGYYTEDDFHQLSKWMQSEFEKRGIKVTEFFYCPHHPTKAKGKYLQSCACRKPNPGMLEQAQKKFDIDMSHSVMIGDNKTDMLAASRAGVAHRYLYSSTPMADDTNIGFKWVDSLNRIYPI
ncbi:D-glycero-beta-D-manno-heptose 1,7-bisphosphate 7-phosphatase [Aliiglaciecola sp. 3_MG-2023]|uniref:D-glycero-beta-D-manno-heptose 1,7-bisphosphate 7-phosphatase n=1 Tax=Aliiglaciecola sp. 3_MG-2023 TaxID=3062644 RepID=UPI0026E3D1BC|nr:D-glycero-beta-D-manno-heptose 1,7-bisphosphate 7-phosphatase [Aliiglaciecola sp. 3_MG-2023]MDO6693411.1 D-glycero-beta-D-manno-heptose 1,7-bisphosphate 7-phosphatase [Aliiglaciecola sp. 3_MG-2023]